MIAIEQNVEYIDKCLINYSATLTYAQEVVIPCTRKSIPGTGDSRTFSGSISLWGCEKTAFVNFDRAKLLGWLSIQLQTISKNLDFFLEFSI